MITIPPIPPARACGGGSHSDLSPAGSPDRVSPASVVRVDHFNVVGIRLIRRFPFQLLFFLSAVKPPQFPASRTPNRDAPDLQRLRVSAKERTHIIYSVPCDQRNGPLRSAICSGSPHYGQHFYGPQGLSPVAVNCAVCGICIALRPLLHLIFLSSFLLV